MSTEDPAAFETAYLEVAKRLVGSARALVGEGQAAEDLVFDTMAHLLPRWDSILGDKTAYAKRSMINRFRDQVRHARVERVYEHRVPVAGCQDHAAEEVESRIDMAAALQNLPARTLQVIVLRYQLDLSTARVASILGITAGNVRKIAYHGLRKLATDLKTNSEGTM